MKTLSILLAFYVLVLSIIPCCADDNCTDGDHSTKTEQTVDNHLHDNDCSGDCSPFSTCGSCVGFTSTTVYFSLTAFPNLLSELDSIYNPASISEFYHAIWQPPKIS